MNFFDLHCDTPYECYNKNQDFDSDILSVSAKHGTCFDNWTQVFAIWIKDDLSSPYDLYRKILEDFKKKLDDAPANLTPLFAVEGGSVLENDADRLFTLKKDGVKFLTLTWNGENQIAGGCNTEKELTQFGKRVIDIMNYLKIGCDMSHLNQKSFFQSLEYSCYPLATHSNSRNLCDCKRNLTDSQIKALCEKDGIIGLCFYPEFLGDGNVFENIYQNIYHICDMGFENHISIGSDFDGAKMDKNLGNTGCIPTLYRFLLKKGLKLQLLEKIFFKNAQNFVAKL